MKTFLSLLISFLFLSVSSAEEPVQITVLGDRVNIRNAATTESDVVSQANYGQTLQAVSFKEEWVEVLPPENSGAWVYSPLLFEDKEVRAPVLNVRSGPGTQFFILGELKRGDPVKVLESLEEWRKIEVPASVTFWISRNFVQVPPSAVQPEPTPKPKLVITVKPTPTPAPTATAIPTPIPTPVTIVEVKTIEKIIEVPVTPTPTPEVKAPEGLDLVPLRGQGNLSKRKGYLRAYILAGSSPSRFVLIRKGANGEEKTLCYLIGDEEALKAATGKNVMVSGHDFWVTGERLPVTNVDKIVVDTESP